MRNKHNTFRPAPYDQNVVDGDDDEDNLTSIDCETEIVANDGLDRDAAYGPVLADTITYALFPDEARFLARQAMFKRLSEYPELLSISSSLDSAFQAFYYSVQTESIGLLDSVSRSIGLSDLTAAANANAAVDDVNSIETNTKFINHLIINKIALDSVPSSADTIALEAIFAQHWMEGGLAVYTAAPLLFKEYYTNIGESRFSGSTQLNVPHEQPEILTQLGIYPNPTHGLINFNRILPPDAIVKVYDTSGREMLIERSPSQINVSNLENGYYILKIFENQSLIFHKNIVIIK